MIRALKDDSRSAIDHFRQLADQYSTRGGDEVFDRMELMKSLWKEGFEGSTFLEKYERARAELDTSTREALFKLDQQTRKAAGLYEQGKSQKQPETIMNAVKALFQLAEQAEQLGDKVMAWRCYLWGTSYLGSVESTKEVQQMQLDAMRRYLTLHEEMDWTKGMAYKRNVTYVKELERSIKSGGAGGGDAKKKAEEGPAKFLEGSKWESFDMLISLQKKPVPGICSPSTANPLEWRGVYLDGTAPTQVRFFQDGEIWIQRTGANEYRYGPSEDKASQYELKIGSKPDQSYIKYMKDGYEVEYGFFGYVPTDRETVNDTSLNYGPQWGVRKSANIFFRSASILYAEIHGEKFEFFDENSNGVVGEAWNAAQGTGDFRFGTGTVQAIGVPLFDSMKRESNKKRLPFSTYVKIGEHWNRLRVTGNNETLRYRPLDPSSIPEGELLVHWKGSRTAKPDHLIVAEVGFYKGAAFDVFANGRKPIQLPAGKYQFMYGRIENGKFPRNNDAVILPGKSRVFDVDPGKLTEITIGAPFHIEFEVEKEGDDVIVDSSTFFVEDSFGLRYGAIGAEVLEPELMVSKKNDAKSGRVIGSWRAVAGQEINEMTRNSNERRKAKGGSGGLPGYHLAFWPMNKDDARNASSVIRVRMPYKNGFVGVRQRRHKLFGKLEHVWK
jgi:hypothetical protein